MKYAGVVVLYNPDEKVKENINTYLKYIDKLYVVDNTPNVDNSKMFKNKKIQYIPNNENKGIAYALNVGAKNAIKEKYDWLLTMDQDSSFEKDGCQKMINFLEDIYINKVLEESLNLKYEQIGVLSVFHKTVQNRGFDPKGIDRPLLVMTSGNFINLKIYKKVNGFKDWLFIDTVDFDYCLNVRKHGYEIIQLNYARLNHNLGETKEKHLLGKTMYASNHNAVRRYYITRNRHYIYDLYHDTFTDYCELELGRTKRELLKIWLFEKDKIEKTKAVYKGYKDYKKGIKGGLN